MDADVYLYPGVAVDAMDNVGVRTTCVYLATALPAGFIPTPPKSPPSAVNALPIATDLAVPS